MGWCAALNQMIYLAQSVLEWWEDGLILRLAWIDVGLGISGGEKSPLVLEGDKES